MSNYLFGSSDNELSDENAKDTAIKRNISTKSFTKEAIAEKLHFLRSFRHDNFVSVIEAFHCEDSSTIEAVVEFMPVAVDELCVRAFPFHDQFSLAAILGQVLQGLSFLENAGFTHMEFTESLVMADLEGNVKIGGQDWCDKGKMLPIQLLPLTQRLMYPWLYFKPVCRDATKWPEDSPAVEFWLATTRPTTSMDELSKSALIQLPWQRSHVKKLVMLAFDEGRTQALGKRLIEEVNCGRCHNCRRSSSDSVDGGGEEGKVPWSQRRCSS